MDIFSFQRWPEDLPHLMTFLDNTPTYSSILYAHSPNSGGRWYLESPEGDTVACVALSSLACLSAPSIAAIQEELKCRLKP